MKYIDIHCHLNFPDYNLDIKETIERARKEDLGMIVVGTNLETSKKAIKLASENENIWAIIGLHPVDIPCEVFDEREYLELAKNNKVVGIGECGFDFFRHGQAPLELQREIFEKQIAIANEVKKPLMLHLRNSIDGKENAYEYALESLKKHAKVSGDTHFFAGNLDQARRFVDLGFRISFTGVITFVRDYDEIVKNIPLNMLMSETDAPFVSPLPYRGSRNEPLYVIEVVKMIAKIRGEDLDKVSKELVMNARQLFSI